jgi:hypothetical protein
MLNRSLKLQVMFSVTGSGSTMNINRLTMSNNNESNSAAWNGIVASAGAEATLTNSEVEGNTNLRVS